MYIKQRNVSEYDVFLGEGWENQLCVKLNHGERKASVVKAEEHVEVTPKLQELIYFKIKKLQQQRKGNVTSK